MKFTLTALIVLVSYQISFSQNRSNNFGFVVMEDFDSTPLNYGFSYWTNDNFSLELIGGYERIEIEDNSGSSVNIGIGALYHFGQNDLTPFVGFRFQYANLSGGDETYEDFVYGPVFGAEYFFSESITLAGEFQFNIINTDKDYSVTGNVADSIIYRTWRYLVLRFYL